MTNDEFGRLAPSALIRVALADIEKVEDDPAYEVETSVWHTPVLLLSDEARRGWGFTCLKPETCLVCVAGATMAMSLGADRSEKWLPCDYPDAVEKRLRALDQFRVGDVTGGLAEMDADDSLDGISINVLRGFYDEMPRYEAEGGAWHEAMEEIASNLEEMGL